jgi:hypothetical protein
MHAARIIIEGVDDLDGPRALRDVVSGGQHGDIGPYAPGRKQVIVHLLLERGLVLLEAGSRHDSAICLINKSHFPRIHVVSSASSTGSQARVQGTHHVPFGIKSCQIRDSTQKWARINPAGRTGTRR